MELHTNSYFCACDTFDHGLRPGHLCDQPMSLVAQLYPDKCVAALVNLWSMKHRTTVTRSITLGNLCIGCLCAQDLAQGRSLAELVKGGWRADEGEVTRIAKELLNILDYLASRRPAVTHR